MLQWITLSESSTTPFMNLTFVNSAKRIMESQSFTIDGGLEVSMSWIRIKHCLDLDQTNKAKIVA